MMGWLDKYLELFLEMILSQTTWGQSVYSFLEDKLHLSV